MFLGVRMKKIYKWKQADGSNWDVIVDYDKLSVEVPTMDYHKTVDTREALDFVVDNFIGVVAELYDETLDSLPDNPMYV